MMIKIEHVIKTYGKSENAVEVLKDISFEVKKGEFVAIVGPSGSGKSTLMNILGALDTPTSGKYFLDGKDVFSMKDDELAQIRSEKIGFVFQSFNLLSNSNVLRNVKIPLLYNEHIKKENRDKTVKKALMSAGLNPEHYKKKANQLSGGQKQRVAIARALVNDPSIVLADEPTGNLDSKTGDIVLKTFKRLNEEEGRTIILITHENYVASQASRIIQIKDGNISENEEVNMLKNK